MIKESASTGRSNGSPPAGITRSWTNAFILPLFRAGEVAQVSPLVAANLYGREGYPLLYLRTVSGRDGIVRDIVVVEEVTQFRHPDIFIADLRLEKEFRTTGNTSLTFSLDGFNLFNNGEVLRDAAIKHQGIALLPTFIIGEALQSGLLQTILNDYCAPEIVLSAVYPRHRFLSTKVRLFLELLVERFGGRPYWDLVD